jgi:hypothetical protein
MIDDLGFSLATTISFNYFITFYLPLHFSLHLLKFYFVFLNGSQFVLSLALIQFIVLYHLIIFVIELEFFLDPTTFESPPTFFRLFFVL